MIFVNYIKSINYFSKNIAFVALTRMCNCRCSACDMWKGKDTIDTEKFIKIGLNKLSDFNFGTVWYTGGEPTLLKDFPSIIKESRERGFITLFATNGTTITEKLSKDLKKNDVNIINVSVDHFDNKIASEYRGFKNIIPKIKNTVQLLREQDIFTASATLITKLNYLDIERIIEFINYELKIPFGFCVPQVSDKFLLGSQLKKTPISKKELIQTFEKILEMKKEGYSITNSNAYIKDLIRWLKNEKVIYNCKAGKKLVYIDWNLDVFPCFIKNRLCGIEEFDSIFLKETSDQCNRCNIQCFREPSIYYSLHGKLELLKEFRNFLPMVRKSNFI